MFDVVPVDDPHSSITDGSKTSFLHAVAALSILALLCAPFVIAYSSSLIVQFRPQSNGQPCFAYWSKSAAAGWSNAAARGYIRSRSDNIGCTNDLLCDSVSCGAVTGSGNSGADGLNASAMTAALGVQDTLCNLISFFAGGVIMGTGTACCFLTSSGVSR